MDHTYYSQSSRGEIFGGGFRKIKIADIGNAEQK